MSNRSINDAIYAFVLTMRVPNTVRTTSRTLRGNKPQIVARAIECLGAFARAHGHSVLAIEWSVTQ